VENISFDPKVYESVFGYIFKYIRANSGNETDAEDIFQEGIIVYWENVQKENFKLTTTPEKYIFSVCRNLWQQELFRRKKYNEPKFFIEVFHNLTISDVEESHKKEKLLGIIEKNINKLPPRGKELYRLKLKGFSLKKIALMMGLKNFRMAKAKTYQSKLRLIELIKGDPEYKELLRNEPEAAIIE
jgi:RNA polymerase sigma factor (sigma-70 family)